ncbi:MAG: 2-oxoacid:ferredoxin oxidoreductase subunit beta [Chloroflexi bacterium]|nr:2-oxoacid:ferredoxin oxidoreductase subunit beta [Chloroflexota bacterium]
MTTVDLNALRFLPESQRLDRQDYQGRQSTLCKGCGHNSIASQIIAVAYELGINPSYIIKLSGIGCSSKSPAYFLGRSHGFNALHGRMPSVATGAVTANRHLLAIGVSGDGDTGSIGMGQFKHITRRNVRMVYIIENNGVYGLTKGQFSATADMGQETKYAGRNELPPIDLCLEALAGEATFVARSFAGAPKQVKTLLKAALSHNGTAILDIISPCVAFNDHASSTKSYAYGRSNQYPLQDMTFVPSEEEIMINEENYDAQGEQVVELHDGSRIILKKLDKGDHDPTDREAAVRLLEDARSSMNGVPKFITGLIYVDPDRQTLSEAIGMTETPLSHLSEEQLRPSRESLEKMMKGLM